MTLDDFKLTLSQSSPPSTLPRLLQAMWYDANGRWEEAHDIAQGINTADGSWVHAYLHRKEGDLGNASYWYHRANKKMSSQTLDEEWREIVTAFLKHT